ncbi:histone-fold-containing protein [Clavulina sp. PMI_390]|nr:histone-fold-containing protein [Clavulina sp. PMI_390]
MVKAKATRFPVARIKKIMQKDEDVGKVAQATPVLISKALELFMAELATKAGQKASDAGSRKVEPWHLKEVVATDPIFDFLKDIVENVRDAPAPSEASEKKKRVRKPKAVAAQEEPEEEDD